MSSYIYYSNMQSGTTLAITIFFSVMVTIFNKSAATNNNSNDRLLKIWLNMSFLFGLFGICLGWLLTMSVNAVGLSYSDNGVRTLWIILIITVLLQITSFFTGYFLDIFDRANKYQYEDNLELSYNNSSDFTQKRICISIATALLIFMIFLIISASIFSLVQV